MSGQTDSGARKIGQAINGFEELAARQVSLDQWRVLSWRNGSITAHKVDTRELSCTCQDSQYNREAPEVCDHLAVALFQAKRQLNVEEALSEQMYDQMKDLDRHVQAIQQKATAVQASDQAGDYDGGQEADSDTTDGFDGDPVEQTQSLLRSAGFEPDQFNVWRDEDYGSVQIETESLSQADFSDYQDWAMETDWLNWDGDNNLNFIKADDFPEVFG